AIARREVRVGYWWGYVDVEIRRRTRVDTEDSPHDGRTPEDGRAFGRMRVDRKEGALIQDAATAGARERDVAATRDSVEVGCEVLVGDGPIRAEELADRPRRGRGRDDLV